MNLGSSFGRKLFMISAFWFLELEDLQLNFVLLSDRDSFECSSATSVNSLQYRETQGMSSNSAKPRIVLYVAKQIINRNTRLSQPKSDPSNTDEPSFPSSNPLHTH